MQTIFQQRIKLRRQKVKVLQNRLKAEQVIFTRPAKQSRTATNVFYSYTDKRQEIF